MNSIQNRRAPWCALRAAFCVLTAGFVCGISAVDITILAPSAGDQIVIGSILEVKFWVSKEVLLSPEASVDSGTNWIGLFPPGFMGCITGLDTTTWTWEANQEDLRPGPALFRIVGYMDPDIEETTGFFTLLPAGAQAGKARFDVRSAHACQNRHETYIMIAPGAQSVRTALVFSANGQMLASAGPRMGAQRAHDAAPAPGLFICPAWQMK